MKPGRRFRRKRGRVGLLTLTSLVDILTILLLFLLHAFSPEGGLLHAAQELELPETTSREGITEGDLVLALTPSGVTLGDRRITGAGELAGGGGLLLRSLAVALGEASGGEAAGRRVLIEGDRRGPCHLP